jgi:hypothetical protein
MRMSLVMMPVERRLKEKSIRSEMQDTVIVVKGDS